MRSLIVKQKLQKDKMTPKIVLKGSLWQTEKKKVFSKTLWPSEQVILTYYVCQKHNLDAAILSSFIPETWLKFFKELLSDLCVCMFMSVYYECNIFLPPGGTAKINL